MDGAMERILTFRFKRVFPDTETMGAVLGRIKAYPWAGEAEVPARLEYLTSKEGRPAHFPFGTVRWTAEDADAFLAGEDELEAVVCARPVNVEARRAAAAAAKARREREKEAARPKPQPTDPALVRPSLRFLLCDEAKAEGRKLWDRLDFIPGGHRALVLNADGLEREFPLIARADAELGGAIRAVLRAAGTLPAEVKDARLKAPWLSVARCIRDGAPQYLTPSFVAGKRVPATVDAALAAIAALRARQEAEIAEKAAAAPKAERRPEWMRECRHPWDVAEKQAELAEKGRLADAGLPQWEIDRLVDEARKQAIAACPEWIAYRRMLDGELAERARLGLRPGDNATPDERALIDRARQLAACPF